MNFSSSLPIKAIGNPSLWLLVFVFEALDLKQLFRPRTNSFSGDPNVLRELDKIILNLTCPHELNREILDAHTE